MFFPFKITYIFTFLQIGFLLNATIWSDICTIVQKNVPMWSKKYLKGITLGKLVIYGELHLTVNSDLLIIY